MNLFRSFKQTTMINLSAESALDDTHQWMAPAAKELWEFLHHFTDPRDERDSDHQGR